MRQIQTKTILKKGEEREANHFDLRIIDDNLRTKATLRYYFISVLPVVDENAETTYITEILEIDEIEIDGTDYTNWGTSGDVNDQIFSIVASKMNITLV